MNPLQKLHGLGQSIWIDFIRRDLMTTGKLAKLIREDSVSGMTSNPKMFQDAIAGSDHYDDAIRDLRKAGSTVEEAYEALTVEDVRMAADRFREVFARTGGIDGYVSYEVSPRLAHNTEGTIEEARRLWKRVDRPNIFIKVPGTLAGLPAIRQLIREGINVNITLLFGLPRYREVAEAYMTGLEERAGEGKPLDHVTSVASFFLSRIDLLVDPLLEGTIAEGGDRGQLTGRLRGKTAIASARLAYQMYKEIFSGDRFSRLSEKGARPQRLLWASTSAKNPDDSDVKYVEALIGPDTVNTMPMETLEAYRDHGDPRLTLEENLDEAREVFDGLARLGIEVDQVTQQLEDEGVEKFVKPYDSLLDTLRNALAPDRQAVGRQSQA